MITADRTRYPTAWRGNLVLAAVTLAYVQSFVDRQVLSLLVEPLKKDLAISDVQVSFLQGLAFASIYCLAGIPLGRAADQFSRRNIIIAGVLFWSAMTMSCGAAGSFGFLLLCRAGVGIGEATLSPSAYSLLSDHFAPQRLPVAMSFYNLGPAIGSGLAYLLGGILLTFSSGARPGIESAFHGLHPWQVTFLIVGASGLAPLALLIWVREPPRIRAAHEVSASANFPETWRFLTARRGTLGLFILGLALLSILSYATLSWYPTMFSRSFGEPASRVGLVYGPLYIVASIVGIISGGWAGTRMAACGTDHPYIRWTLAVACGACVLASCLPFLLSLKLAYAAAAILVLLQNAWFGTAMAAIHLAVPNRMRAQTTALLLFSTNILGLVLGPTAVASITQYVFRDQHALRYSLAIVSFCSGSVACLVLYRSLQNFRRDRMSTAGIFQTAGA
jgi:MFS family permease